MEEKFWVEEEEVASTKKDGRIVYEEVTNVSSLPALTSKLFQMRDLPENMTWK